MAKRLSKLMVEEVSGVDKGANGKRFLILKSASPDEGAEMFGKRRKAGSTGPDDGGSEMTPEDITKAITDAADTILEPVFKRIELLEAAAQVPAEVVTLTEPVVKVETSEETTDTEIIVSAVEKAMEPIVARIALLEHARGVRKSAGGEAVPESGSIWSGVL